MGGDGVTSGDVDLGVSVDEIFYSIYKHLGEKGKMESKITEEKSSPRRDIDSRDPEEIENRSRAIFGGDCADQRRRNGCGRGWTDEDSRLRINDSLGTFRASNGDAPPQLFVRTKDFSRSLRLLKKDDLYKKYAYIINRFRWSKADGDELNRKKGNDKIENNPTSYSSGMNNYSSSEDELSGYSDRWKPEIAWLGKALEPALQLYKWALPSGNGVENKPPPTDRSLAEIFSSIQRSKLGIQDWSLSDLTIGLYLIYLRQASTSAAEDVKGELISSESIGFRLRLVGHSLGGATASLLAIKLRKKSIKELGFSPDIVTAVGYATPPCVSKELAESCSDFVTTVVMQDDIVPRLSVASLTRLRNEIVETDWVSVFSREDWKGVIDLVTNAKQVVSSVQDVARKLAEYAKFRGQTKYSEMPMKKEVPVVTSFKTSLDHQVKHENPASKLTDDLFVPGTLYYLKRNEDGEGDHKHGEYFTLLRRNPGEHFQRILLSSNLISDHKCDSHYYALRDVLKGLPSSLDDRNIN
ncbi:hypothetical protein DH2020_017782 [Rehmannia glutinosa]|uniref:Fungal lipase-type domain-containing protein n=1 Tax=Rehmannia glutinosa TaxID=99300 RepID=A0ABR0WRX4_REHGL